MLEARKHRNERSPTKVELRDAERCETPCCITCACTIFARRAARAAAGAALVAGGVALGAVGFHDGGAIADESPGLVIAGSWLAAAAAFGAVRLGAVRWYNSGVGSRMPIAFSGDFARDLARIRLMLDPLGVARLRTDRLEFASVALPLAGVALLGPLSIHLLCATLLGSRIEGAAFLSWVRAIVALTAHAHLALALSGAVFAWKIRRLKTIEIPYATARDGWLALLLAIWASAVPGGFVVPAAPALALLTGVLFVPAVYAALGRCVAEERETLGLDAALDRAPEVDPCQRASSRELDAFACGHHVMR